LNELSINIHIAGRAYPLTVTDAEEANVRAAGKLIQDKLNVYQKQFALKDQRDALAMLALELATEIRALKEAAELANQDLQKELDSMQQLLAHVQL
jgi:cell division protein ZapA (FtsZ GTPase activity inhibitor)